MSTEEKKIYSFRHKTIRRFHTAGFEFENYELDVIGEDELERFMEVFDELPDRERNQIVRIDREAAAKAEQTLVGRRESGVVRDAMTASDILTAKDREAIANAQGVKSGTTGAEALNPTPQKPTGFAGFGNQNK